MSLNWHEIVKDVFANSHSSSEYTRISLCMYNDFYELLFTGLQKVSSGYIFCSYIVNPTFWLQIFLRYFLFEYHIPAQPNKRETRGKYADIAINEKSSMNEKKVVSARMKEISPFLISALNKKLYARCPIQNFWVSEYKVSWIKNCQSFQTFFKLGAN